MLIPLSWLKEFIDLDESPAEVAEILTLAGLEVDAIRSVTLGFEGVVVGEVRKAEPHPEADKLKLAEVVVGDTAVQVVCGAPNCRAGMKTAFAQIGARLKTSDGETFKIKKSKLRGAESHGMLCSSAELGLDSADDGIMELDAALPTGLSLAEMYGDTVFDISLTPNLGHCMSVRGIARELSLLLGRPLKEEPHPIGATDPARTSELFQVSLEEGCDRYCALLVENVTVGPSPDWLVRKLEAAGTRSINNVVDITNYLMLGWGQPLHAFDADKLAGGEISVRPAPEELTLETLDDKTHTVPKGTLLIWDAEKPIAIAGVMGGANSAVDETTTRVLLEGAHFCPSAVRRTSKQLSLRTDSSARFERGVDREAPLDAVRLAGELLRQEAHGDVCREPIDERIGPHEKRAVIVRLSAVNRLLGTTLAASELEEILGRIGTLTPQGDTYGVAVPSWRNDLREEVDLIEEVARIYGLGNIDTGTAHVKNSSFENDPRWTIETRLREILVEEGLQEAICCDLIGPDTASIVSPEDFLAPVLKPSSIDQSVLRPSLLPGLLDSIRRNIAHGTSDLAFFEIGRVHYKEQKEFFERPMLAIAFTGAALPRSWAGGGREADFFDAKGILERLFGHFTIPRRSYARAEIDLFHPGRQATVTTDSRPLAFLGELHPATAARFDIDRRVYFAQVEIDTLLSFGWRDKIMEPLPLYPGSERDWTVSYPKDRPVEELLAAIRTIPSRLLKGVDLLDVYEREELGDKRNITLRFTYRDAKKTVACETVDKEHARLLATLNTALN